MNSATACLIGINLGNGLGIIITRLFFSSLTWVITSFAGALTGTSAGSLTGAFPVC